ncbi:MAG: hypothetical protein IE931_12605 [Sphingobacteriales bacterium]|nr:hypothetical protein [Sphingobacteriales bacterium]
MVLLLINSCKKDNQTHQLNSQLKPNSDFLVEAKAYFEENYQDVQPKQNLSNSHQPDDLFKRLGKQVLWRYAKKTKISLGEAIRVPVYYDRQTFTRKGKNKAAIDLYNISYLMMYKDKKHRIHTEWVITIPDDDFVDKNPLSNPKFSGLIYILDWKGSLIKAYKITPDGHQYISNDISFSEGDKQLMVSDTRKTDYTYQECTQTGYFQDCNNGCTGGQEYVFVTSCYWVSIDDGGGGGDGGITPIDPVTGGGGGATSPGDYPPSNPNCPEAPIGNSTGNIKVDMVSPNDPCGKGELEIPLNKLCSSSFNFKTIVSPNPNQNNRGWKEASVAGLQINVVTDNYWENIWNVISNGSSFVVGKFNLEVGVPGDLPNAIIQLETGYAVNKAVIELERGYGTVGMESIIKSGQLGFQVAKLSQIYLSEYIPGCRISSTLSGRTFPSQPITGLNCN